LNFLAHFFLLPAHASPLMVLGGSLPDLLHLHTSYRIHKKIPYLFDTKDTAESGIAIHLHIDNIFHQCHFFLQWKKILLDELRNAGLVSIPHYLPFYVHIIIEMMIDRILLRENKDLAYRFYEKMRLLSKADMEKVWLYHQFAKDDFMDFWAFFQGFLERQFLVSYASDEGFIVAISGLAMRLHGYELLSKDGEKILAACKVLDVSMCSHWSAFWEMMQGKLISALPDLYQ